MVGKTEEEVKKEGIEYKVWVRACMCAWLEVPAVAVPRFV
jgi:hypothetical protein